MESVARVSLKQSETSTRYVPWIQSEASYFHVRLNFIKPFYFYRQKKTPFLTLNINPVVFMVFSLWNGRDFHPLDTRGSNYFNEKQLHANEVSMKATNIYMCSGIL